MVRTRVASDDRPSARPCDFWSDAAGRGHLLRCHPGVAASPRAPARQTLAGSTCCGTSSTVVAVRIQRSSTRAGEWAKREPEEKRRTRKWDGGVATSSVVGRTVTARPVRAAAPERLVTDQYASQARALITGTGSCALPPSQNIGRLVATGTQVGCVVWRRGSKPSWRRWPRKQSKHQRNCFLRQATAPHAPHLPVLL